jgi:hypothetical protein
MSFRIHKTWNSQGQTLVRIEELIDDAGTYIVWPELFTGVQSALDFLHKKHYNELITFKETEYQKGEL